MNQRSFTHIILAVIIIIAGAIGYVVLVKKSNPTPTSVQAPFPMSTTTESTASGWKNPEKIEIIGYDGDAIESAISKDGQYLFFNNNYQKPKETTVFYAKKIDDKKFQFLGEVQGIKDGKHYSMTAGIDSDNNLYFSSDRADGKTPKIYRGTFKEGKISQVMMLPGTINQKRAWDPDTFEGSVMYYTENNDPLDDFNISVSTGETSLLQNINTDKMEYAPSLSQDKLELFFTKANVKSILGIFSGEKAKIYTARRKSISEPFGKPEIIEAIAKQDDDAFVEAPTITADGKTLYYHKKDSDKFAIYRVIR